MNLLIYTDGASRGNPGLAGAGFIAKSNKDLVLGQQSIFLGKKTNNEAEYLAFLASLIWLKEQKIDDLESVSWFLDSKLVVEQINKNWKIKQNHLRILANQCWKILDSLSFNKKITHIPREKNAQADALANTAMDLAQELPLSL